MYILAVKSVAGSRVGLGGFKLTHFQKKAPMRLSKIRRLFWWGGGGGGGGRGERVEERAVSNCVIQTVTCIIRCYYRIQLHSYRDDQCRS